MTDRTPPIGRENHDAATARKASGDPVKRATYNYQRWLAAWRKYGGESSAEAARYVRLQLRQARGALLRGR